VLYHYIVVRRDLPVGVTVAQVAHAAGESFAAYASSSVKEHRTFSPEVGGSSPSSRTSLPPPSQEGVASNGEGALKATGGAIPTPHVVVLGARDQVVLARLARKALTAGVRFVSIVEPDAPYHGELLALGFWPAEREVVRPLVEKFQLYAG
jgi:hypothetical protein